MDRLHDWVFLAAMPEVVDFGRAMLSDMAASPFFAGCVLLAFILSALMARHLGTVVLGFAFLILATSLHALLPTRILKEILLFICLLGYGSLASSLFHQRREASRFRRILGDERSEKVEVQTRLDNEIKWRKASE